jgi:hypothetical protein
MNIEVEFLKILLNSAVLVALVTALAPYFSKRYEAIIARRKAKRNVRGLIDSMSTLEEIQILRVRTKFERIIIAKVHNGGHPITPTSAKFVTCLEDTFSNQINESVKAAYQRVLIDDQYRALLAKAMSRKYYHVKTEDLGKPKDESGLRDPHGMLYNQYKSVDVSSVFFFYLGAVEDGIIWMSCQSIQLHDELSAEEIVHIKTCLSVIRQKLGVLEKSNVTL